MFLTRFYWNSHCFNFKTMNCFFFGDCVFCYSLFPHCLLRRAQNMLTVNVAQFHLEFHVQSKLLLNQDHITYPHTKYIHIKLIRHFITVYYSFRIAFAWICRLTKYTRDRGSLAHKSSVLVVHTKFSMKNTVIIEHLKFT